MFKKLIALLGAALFVVSISSCNWFVTQPKPKFGANKEKPSAEKPVADASEVQKIN